MSSETLRPDESSDPVQKQRPLRHATVRADFATSVTGIAPGQSDSLADVEPGVREELDEKPPRLRNVLEEFAKLVLRQ